MRQRLPVFAMFLVLFTCLVVATYDTAAQFCGRKIEVGDPVIVHSTTCRLPAVVTGFWEKGVKVRSEGPGTIGMVLRFHFDECRATTRESAEWRQLTTPAP